MVVGERDEWITFFSVLFTIILRTSSSIATHDCYYLVPTSVAGFLSLPTYSYSAIEFEWDPEGREWQHMKGHLQIFRRFPPHPPLCVYKRTHYGSNITKNVLI